MTEFRELDYTGSERLTMNMGPQHPSAHGVFRAILTLEGEQVVAVDAVIGYLHRCHEKLAETLAYVQYPSIASKTDYVAAMTSELAYVMAAEEIGKFEVPKRAQYLRRPSPREPQDESRGPRPIPAWQAPSGAQQSRQAMRDHSSGIRSARRPGAPGLVAARALRAATPPQRRQASR